MFHVDNKYRTVSGPLASNDVLGNNGLFIFRKDGHMVNCVVSDGGGWEHVSVTINRARTPGWDTMCFVKDQFWGEEDVVMQIHPRKSDYVNFHPYCLHLWRRTGIDPDCPPKSLVNG